MIKAPKFVHAQQVTEGRSLTALEQRALRAFEIDLKTREYDVLETDTIRAYIVKFERHTARSSFGIYVRITAWTYDGHAKDLAAFPRELSLKRIREILKCP